MNMNNFENPKDIINKEDLATEEKIAPIENARTAQEKLDEIKIDMEKLKTLQKEISNKIDQGINNLSDDIVNRDYSIYQEKEMALRLLQDESTSISLKIYDKIEEFQFLFSAINKVKNLDQSSRQN